MLKIGTPIAKGTVLFKREARKIKSTPIEVPQKRKIKKPPLGIYTYATVKWFKDPIHPNENYKVLYIQMAFQKVLIKSKVSKVERWVSVYDIKNILDFQV